MKALKFFLPFFLTFFSIKVVSQNVSVNVLTQKSGVISKGETVFLDATINNTDPSLLVGVYKLKVQVSVADPAIDIETTGHNLPTGWEIISNTNNTIMLSNGKDIIAANDSRTVLIAMKGKDTGGPVTISGQLSFSNGVAPGTDPGSSKGDNPADNFSTSTCKIIQ